jgi:SAM-dependent methyltransferase
MEIFTYDGAIKINKERIKHLDNLKLNFKDKKILETGCGGKGDFTKYLLQFTQNISLNDTRSENINNLLKTNNLNLNYNTWDLNENLPENELFDIIFSYGTFYHLHNPENAIKNLSIICKDFIIIETITNGKNDMSINICNEDYTNLNQSTTGSGCRPGRNFIFNLLKKYFKHVYTLKTQPIHEEFPLVFPSNTLNNRCIFIGSHNKIENDMLLEYLNNSYIN